LQWSGDLSKSEGRSLLLRPAFSEDSLEKANTNSWLAAATG
jgi:hypothetical protein